MSLVLIGEISWRYNTVDEWEEIRSGGELELAKVTPLLQLLHHVFYSTCHLA